MHKTTEHLQHIIPDSSIMLQLLTHKGLSRAQSKLTMRRERAATALALIIHYLAYGLRANEIIHFTIQDQKKERKKEKWNLKISTPQIPKF